MSLNNFRLKLTLDYLEVGKMEKKLWFGGHQMNAKNR